MWIDTVLKSMKQMNAELDEKYSNDPDIHLAMKVKLMNSVYKEAHALMEFGTTIKKEKDVLFKKVYKVK